MTTETSTIKIAQTPEGFTASIDDTPVTGLIAPNLGALLTELGRRLGTAETIIASRDLGVSDTAVAIIMSIVMRSAAAGIEDHLKKNTATHLARMLEVSTLKRAERIPFADLTRSVLGAFSAVQIVTPVSEAERLSAELVAEVLAKGSTP